MKWRSNCNAGIRTTVRGLAALLLAAMLPLGSLAAGYPEKSITIVVPYPAGGVTDLMARALADSLAVHVSQPVVVLNKSGAGATIGGNAVATADPDGYTLGFFPVAAAVPEVFRFAYSAPYSSRDLKPISAVAATAMSFAVKSDSPIRSMKDIVDLARRSGGLLIGTPGKQTLPSMIMAKMAAKEGVKLEDAPFGGDAKTLPALLGGHVQVGAIDFAALKASVEAGKIRVLAVCTEKRIDLAPDIPTVLELGYELPYVSSLGLFGPKDLPESVARRLDELVSKIVAEPKFAGRAKEMSIQVAYKDSASYRPALARDRDNLEAFFTQQGMYKK